MVALRALKMRFFASLRMTRLIRNAEFGIRNYWAALPH